MERYAVSLPARLARVAEEFGFPQGCGMRVRSGTMERPDAVAERVVELLMITVATSGRIPSRCDGSLQSPVELLSQASMTCIAMWLEAEDRAAVIYDVEFLRACVSGRSVATAHRVAVAQEAIDYPSQAGAAFRLPGLVNGYSRIEQALRQQAQVLSAIEERLTRIERGLGQRA